MQKIIDRKVYDTEAAELVARNVHDEGGEDLYRTEKGAWFVFTNAGNWGTEDIAVLSDEEAHEWLVDKHFADAIRKHFPESDVRNA